MTTQSLSVTNLFRGLALAGLLFAPLAASAATTPPPLTQASVSDLVGNVTISPKANPTQEAPAKLQDIFTTEQRLSTGRKSHAQLTATDNSIIRVGSDTEFSLEPNSRTINLAKGSILFNSPKGFGGNVTTGSATATVTGTTIIVSATPDGGFKLLVLEGTATLKLPNGQTLTLKAGQMSFVLPASKGGGAGPVLNFDLKEQVATSALVNGFTLSLPSQDLIVDATNTQQKQISTGALQRTGQVVVGAVSPDQVVLTDSTTFDNVNNVNNPMTASADLVLGPTLDVPLPSANETPVNGTVFTAGSFGLPNGVIPNNQVLVTGLIGNNVSASGYVNLAPIDGLSSVDILAQNTFTFTNAPDSYNVTLATPDIAHPDQDSSFTEFTGMNTSLILSLAAKSGFVFPSESDVEAVFTPPIFPSAPTDTNIEIALPSVASPTNTNNIVFPSFSTFSTTFSLSSIQSDLNLGNLGIDNASGGIQLYSVAGNVSLNGTFISGGFEATNNVNSVIQSDLGSVQINNAYIYSASESFVANPLTAVPAAGFREGVLNVNAPVDISINSTSVNAGSLTVVGGGNVSISNSTGGIYSLAIIAGGNLAISNSSVVNTASNVVVAGNTVVLSNLSGTGAVSAYSESGILNTNGTVIPGDVNIISNVTFSNSTIGVTAANPLIQTAMTLPVTINASSNATANIYQNVLFTPQELGEKLGDDNFEVVNGLIAGNLSLSGCFSLASINVSGGVVDLAAQNINLSNNTFINSPGGYGKVRLLSSGGFSIPSGALIGFAPQSSSFTAELDSVPGIDFEQITIQTTGQFGGTSSLNINSAEGDLTFNGSTLSTNSNNSTISLLTAGGGANLTFSNSSLLSSRFGSTASLQADNIVIAANSNISTVSTLTLTGGTVGVTVDNSTLYTTGGPLNVYSNRDVTIANNSILHSSTSEVSTPSLNVYAAHVVTVTNSTLQSNYANLNAGLALNMDTVNLNSATAINMSARTINLSNINFPGGLQVQLNSQNGMLAPNPNTNAASVVGDVNFIHNVTYGNQPAQNYVPTSVGGGNSSISAPIQIGTLGTTPTVRH
jgi:hypothetical protein